MVDKPMTADAEALGARERHRLATAAWHGEEALQPVPLLVRRAGDRGGGHIALYGLCQLGQSSYSRSHDAWVIAAPSATRKDDGHRSRHR
jgi:hypothetical protein